MSDPKTVGAADRDILQRLATHLGFLARRAGQVEATVGALVINPSDDAIMQLQFLDDLRQSLEDVAHLVERLGAREDSALCPATLGAGLRLEATRNLLAGTAVQSEFRDGPAAGEVDLF